MAMTGAGLAAARDAAIAAVAQVQTSNPATAAAYATALRLADSTAIVTYIQQNMGVASSGADPQGGVVTSASTAIT
jgi:hypothetical protein